MPADVSNSVPSVPTGRLVGIDYGTVRIGIAITDREQRIASPLANYTRRTTSLDAKYFGDLVTHEQIAAFVVGLPLHLDGRESQKSSEARQFGQWLKDLTGLPIIFFDERFTTVEAEHALSSADLTKKKRKARLDKLAAQMLLAAFLEAGKPASAHTRGLDD
jgi:putative holliday junction resolvase